MPKKYFPKRSRKNTRRRVYPKMSFDKRVLQVVNTQRELKVAKINGDLVIPSSVTGPTLLQLLPDIFQAGNVGASNANQEFYRDGNSITLKKILLRWWITQRNPASGLPQQDRVVVRHMILRQRGANANQVLQGGGTDFLQNNLLENAQPFVGDIPSIQTPINKAAFVSRMDKRHYFSSANVNPNGNIPADGVNSFKLGQKNITFGKGKKLHFNTGGADIANNFPYFLALGASTVDGIPAQGMVYNYSATAYFYDS